MSRRLKDGRSILTGADRTFVLQGRPPPVRPQPTPPTLPAADARDAATVVAYFAVPADWTPDRARRAAHALTTLARHEAALAKWSAREGDLDESAIRWREAVFLNTEAARVGQWLTTL